MLFNLPSHHNRLAVRLKAKNLSWVKCKIFGNFMMGDIFSLSLFDSGGQCVVSPVRLKKGSWPVGGGL